MGKYLIPIHSNMFACAYLVDNVGNLLDFGLCYLDSMVDDWFSAGFLVVYYHYTLFLTSIVGSKVV